MIIVLIVPNPLPCVGVTYSGHRILNWVEDEMKIPIAMVEGVGECYYSFRYKSVFIQGEWHPTEAVPQY